MNKYLAIGLATLLAGCGGTQPPKVETHVGKPIAVTYDAGCVTTVLQNGQKQELVRMINISGIKVNDREEYFSRDLAAILIAEQNDGDNDLIQITETTRQYHTTTYEVKTGIKPEAQAPALNLEHK